MKTALTLLLSLLFAVACFGQSSAAKWKVASITGVRVHEPAVGSDSSAPQYEVTSRIENTEYVVLYVVPAGTLPDIARYRLGQEIPSSGAKKLDEKR